MVLTDDQEPIFYPRRFLERPGLPRARDGVHRPSHRHSLQTGTRSRVLGVASMSPGAQGALGQRTCIRRLDVPSREGCWMSYLLEGLCSGVLESRGMSTTVMPRGLEANS